MTAPQGGCLHIVQEPPPSLSGAKVPVCVFRFPPCSCACASMHVQGSVLSAKLDTRLSSLAGHGQEHDTVEGAREAAAFERVRTVLCCVAR